MPTTYSVGSSITLTATFISYDPATDGETMINPSSVDGVIKKLNTSTLEYEDFSTFTPTAVGDNSYTYDWVTTEDGKFNILITAEFLTGQTAINSRFIFVGAISTTDTLDTNVIYTFLGQLDPLFLDPEMVLLYYPDADLNETTELIHWYSKEIMSLLKLTTLDASDITPLMEDFILASVLCDLSKIHTFGGGLAGFTTSDSFSLGDLSVKSTSGSGFSQGGSGTRGGVTTWCDLAALLRDELTASRNGAKTYVRGSNYSNPMPPRHLRRKD